MAVKSGGRRRRRRLEQGLVQVYTGDGKGKTTAALGLTLRALGAGLRVFVAQFVKGMHYSELAALARLGEDVQVHQYGRDCFIRHTPTAEDVRVARVGLEAAAAAASSGEWDVVVLDEASIAVHYELFSIDELLQLIDARAPRVEVVVTGRKAHPRLLERADLVTEMREVKHYYQRGVEARPGIES